MLVAEGISHCDAEGVSRSAPKEQMIRTFRAIKHLIKEGPRCWHLFVLLSTGYFNRCGSMGWRVFFSIPVVKFKLRKRHIRNALSGSLWFCRGGLVIWGIFAKKVCARNSIKSSRNINTVQETDRKLRKPEYQYRYRQIKDSGRFTALSIFSLHQHYCIVTSRYTDRRKDSEAKFFSDSNEPVV